MIKAEGFMAFRGIMRIVPFAKHLEPFEVQGDWIYNPETDCWYGNGSSYPEEICEVREDGTVENV